MGFLYDAEIGRIAMGFPKTVDPGDRDRLLLDANNIGIEAAQCNEITLERAFVPDRMAARDEWLATNDVAAGTQGNTPNGH